MKNRVSVIALLILLISCTPPRNTYINGFKAWREGRYEEAVALFSKLIYRHKNSRYAPKAAYYMGNIYHVNLKRHEHAVLEYQKAIVLSNFSGKFAYLSQKSIAEIYKNEFKSYENAIFEYKELFKYPEHSKDSVEIFNSLFQCFLNKRLFEDGEKELLLLLKVERVDKEHIGLVYLMLGNFAKLQNKTEDAISYYQQAEKSGGYEEKADFLLAELYWENRMFDKAIPIYKKLLEKDLYRQIIEEKLKSLDTINE